MNRYTMTFALSPDFGSVLLLRKPDTHPNPLFRGKWTAPGGLIEEGESEAHSATRELEEETQLRASAMRFVLRFSCNCDPQEAEHEVAVYGTVLPFENLKAAHGEPSEPVAVFGTIPESALWYVEPLLQIVIGRMRQP